MHKTALPRWLKWTGKLKHTYSMFVNSCNLVHMKQTFILTVQRKIRIFMTMEKHSETYIFGGLLLWWQNACYLLFTFGVHQWNSGNKHAIFSFCVISMPKNIIINTVIPSKFFGSILKKIKLIKKWGWGPPLETRHWQWAIRTMMFLNCAVNTCMVGVLMGPDIQLLRLLPSHLRLGASSR